ncbi:ribonuclease P protein component [Pannonibacter indicus]|uniref:Ribonuclease P protein component n=1 Tax=Pannonibacter indicus TaxID=466044 RepID=A0A0K6HT61_9HYPH|nr:ribonuclease P protein component [Pannonibacter indicus]CUA94217.1 ribonuclease P protein component, eubacterial [Pannonibacter indicus]
MKTLKKRSEFLAVAKGGRTDRRAFALQGLKREDDGPARVGYTVTKKTGNAVERNRIKRRLRAAVAQLQDEDVPSGADFVIIGRRAALNQPFADLVRELNSGLKPALERKGNGSRQGRRDNRKPKAGGQAQGKEPAQGSGQRQG